MQFALRGPRLPCIAFSGGLVHAASTYAALAKIVQDARDGEIHIHDLRGNKFEYYQSGGFIAPGFPMQPITKKALLDKVFSSGNMASVESKLRHCSLTNTRFEELVLQLAALIEEQGGTQE